MKTIFFLFLWTVLYLPGIHHQDAKAHNISEVLSVDHHLHASFNDFALFRIQTVNSNYNGTPDKVLLKPRGSQFVARYQIADPETVFIQVKKTDSSLTPFIGVLQYTESVYESNGGCRVSVVEGPFLPVLYRNITEIFRYVDNGWQ